MTVRRAILGKRFVLDSASPVNGLVLCPSANRFSLSVRLYVCPSTVMTDTLKRKKRLPLLMLTQLTTCFLVVLALVLLLDICLQEWSPLQGVTTNTGPDVRVCCPLLMYLFIDRCTPTCPFAFFLYFLPLFLGISYSKRVSHQDPVWAPFIPPSTSQEPSLEEHRTKGQEEKGRQTRKKT